MDSEHCASNEKGIGHRGGQRAGAGRKPIGVTRKLSLTLPPAYWEEIERHCGGRQDYAVSAFIRSIIEDYLQQADQL
ncbi:hypothetical protein [Paenibacillus sp. NEAU-GSW1]|uniref:hypothetical protein n=1 Tax=Paenibacillus sp. NEAU-GSW1 TaxID=2682486 RepID=UPI0012E0D1F8|nr:hypothetical protein [Paenibacillus sp. NEAU-GSW1]MUT64815.1 hypothetical protein [Paenibacillus sp. NEAU-GSW1]